MKTLNIGCGTRTYTEYPEGYKCINIDERNLAGVNMIADVSELLPFKDGEFHYILASDIIEHFPLAQIPEILNEWNRILATGCIIEFKLPDLEAIVEVYGITGDAKHVSKLLYGDQNYSGNYHYVCFDRYSFRALVEKHRFKVIQESSDGTNIVIKAIKEG